MYVQQHQHQQQQNAFSVEQQHHLQQQQQHEQQQRDHHSPATWPVHSAPAPHAHAVAGSVTGASAAPAASAPAAAMAGGYSSFSINELCNSSIAGDDTAPLAFAAHGSVHSTVHGHGNGNGNGNGTDSHSHSNSNRRSIHSSTSMATNGLAAPPSAPAPAPAPASAHPSSHAHASQLAPALSSASQSDPSDHAPHVYADDADVQLAVEALGGLRNAHSTAAMDALCTSTPGSGLAHDGKQLHMQQVRSIDALSTNFVKQMTLFPSASAPLSDPAADAALHEQQQQQQQQQQQEQDQQQQQQQQHQDQPLDQRQPQPQGFVKRVSSIPLVNSSINRLSHAYEATKNASTVVKYSAESVESGVKTITKPVLNTLEPALAPLDRFACNQLDRLERSVPYFFGGSAATAASSASSAAKALAAAPSVSVSDAGTTGSSITATASTTTTSSGSSPAVSMLDPNAPRSRSSSIASSVDILAPPSIPLFADPTAVPRSPSLGPYSPATSSSSYPESPYPNSLAHRGSIDERLPSTAPHVERKPRSRWHQVVAGVGANLGMITDDTMRALRYCLQFLQYAIANIDRQAGLLKQYLANAGSSVHGLVTGGQTSGSTAVIAAPFGAGLVAMLVAIRREIVETLRKVVDLVGRNASVYLTGDARQSVRGFILNLPSRLAGLAQRTPLANAGTLIEAASNAASGAGEQSEYAEAERVLTLASESSAMLKGIENVFSRTVDVSERVLGSAPYPHPSSAGAPGAFDSLSASAASGAQGLASAGASGPAALALVGTPGASPMMSNGNGSSGSSSTGGNGSSTHTMRRRRVRTSSRSSRISAAGTMEDDTLDGMSESMSQPGDMDDDRLSAPSTPNAIPTFPLFTPSMASVSPNRTTLPAPADVDMADA